jgi:hypothetical protein
MTNPRSFHAWILAAVVWAAVATALSGSATAQTVQDPGVRGGPPGAGGPLPNLVPGGAGFFSAATTFFTHVNSVTGTINDGAALGVANGGPGLGPRYNLNQCSGCHTQPAVGGTSPAVNRQMAGATLDGAKNIVPPFITRNGPVRKARFVRNPDGTPDGFVHELYVITGRPDAPGCNIAQPNFAAELAANNVIFRINADFRPWIGRGHLRSRPYHSFQFKCGAKIAVRRLRTFQCQLQRRHHHPIWLEGAEQVFADVLGGGLQRRDRRDQRAVPPTRLTLERPRAASSTRCRRT